MIKRVEMTLANIKEIIGFVYGMPVSFHGTPRRRMLGEARKLMGKREFRRWLGSLKAEQRARNKLRWPKS